MLIELTYSCAYCGEPNDTFVEKDLGDKQDYVEDCAVCCRPNLIHIYTDRETGELTITSEYDG
jgi:hypothetical protein